MDALARTGNPVSVHAHGRALKALIEDARAKVAKLAGAERTQVQFTSSATEALTQAIVGGAGAFGADVVIVSAVEHKSVLNAAKMAGPDVEIIGVDENGLIVPEHIAALVARLDAAGQTGLFALQMVNNETGVIQPLSEIEAIIGPSAHILVVDAVQAFGKLDLEFSARAADMMAITSHKIGGPAGVGALLMKSHCENVRILPGGAQEAGRRGGTEPWPLIAGFGEATRVLPAHIEAGKMAALLERIELGVRAFAPDAVVFGEAVARVGNVSFIGVPGVTNSVAFMGLDLEGVSVSTGSACTSGKVTRSHVLDAMGVDPQIGQCAIRVSLGWSSTKDDVDAFLGAFEKIVSRKRHGREQVA